MSSQTLFSMTPLTPLTSPSSSNMTIRTHSSSSRQPNLPRTPSQQKISITCQGGSRLPPKHLRRGSLPTNQPKLELIRHSQSENLISGASLGEVGKYLKQKLAAVEHKYQAVIQQQQQQINRLSQMVAHHSREIDIRQREINSLTVALQRHNKKAQLIAQSKASMSNLSTRLSDAEVKLKLISGVHSQTEKETQDKIDHLTSQIVAFTGNKLQNLQRKLQEFMEQSSTRLGKVENSIEASLKQSSLPATQETIQAESHLQNVSFWDDCFFYPGERNWECEWLLDMAQRRGHSLHCWVDQQGHLRYCETNSYVFGRRGDRIELTVEERAWLVQQKALTLY